MRQNVIKSLPVDLTDQELLVRGAELAAAADRVRLKEEEIKEVRASMRADLDELELAHSELVKVVRNKRENRDVECRWEPDYARKVWMLFRCDNDERVAVEAMSEHDLQTRIIYEDPTTGEITNKNN